MSTHYIEEAERLAEVRGEAESSGLRVRPAGPAIAGVMSREVANFHTYWKGTTFSSVLDVEELGSAEMLWIGLRAGVYACFPLIVTMAFGLDPARGTVNPLHRLVELVRGGAFGFEAVDLLRFAYLVAFALLTWRIAIARMRRRLID